MVPAGGGSWWALADNGYGARANSADFQLVIHRLDPRWDDPAGPRVLATTILHDPDRRIPWTIVCDQTTGTPLPGFSFNVLPLRPPACGSDASARILTGFDLDPESFVRARRHACERGTPFSSGSRRGGRAQPALPGSPPQKGSSDLGT
jgi:hypothetical protein